MATFKEEEKVPFTWKITFAEFEKFLHEEKAQSRVFNGGPKGNHTWQLEMRRGPLPKGVVAKDTEIEDSDSEDSEGESSRFDIGVYIKLLAFGNDDGNGCEAAIRFEVYIKSHQKAREHILDYFPVTKEEKLISVGNPVGMKFANLIKAFNIGRGYQRESEYMIIDGVLLIEHPPRKSFKRITDDYQNEHQFNSLKTMLKSIMKDSFTDAELKVGSHVFRVHKCILASRSKVFDAMFSSGMKEAETNVVEIDDDPDIVKAMLKYMYYGDILGVEERPCDIVRIADKYELLELKDVCEKLIVPTLTVTNAVEALLCAYEHNLKTALPEIMKFVNRNHTEISETGTLTEVFKRYPQLSMELYLSQKKTS